MEKHFELTEEFKINFLGVKLFRIKATKKSKWADIGNLGGWIESEKNVSGDAWVSGNAEVSGNARVFGDARVYGNAWVSGNARVSGDAWVYGDAEVSGDAWVSGNAEVSGDAWVSGNAEVSGNARVYGNADLKSNNDYCLFQNFGSSNRTTTFFKTKENSIYVKCGCFKGSLESFSEKIKETHGENKFFKEYEAIINVVKIKFDL